MGNKLKIVVRLSGGLGNQLHQYAYALFLAKKTGGKVYVDKTFYKLDYKKLNITKRTYELDNFLVKPEEYTFFLTNYNLLRLFLAIPLLRYGLAKLLKIRIINSRLPEPEFYGNEKIYYVIDVFGRAADYMQILDELKFTFQPGTKKMKILALVEQRIVRANAVAVHVRRTDYLNPDSIHEVLNIDYYQKAMSLIKQKISKPIFYIFGDDEQWIREQFSILNDPDIIFTNFKGEDAHMFDFFAISYCEHCILSNSTFAWWAAFLNENFNKIVIAPSKWLKGNRLNTNDAYLNDWHVI